MKTMSLVGARPQFVKEAMLNSAIAACGGDWKHVLVHSGQHYDADMSDIFFRELNMPAPDYNLGVCSGTHAEITGKVLMDLEPLLLKEKPDCLTVYGDTDTTIGGALAAAKLNIPVVHIEAGERSLPKSMPEEINRVLTDHMSSVLCVVSAVSRANLEREGIFKGVHICGDIMLDVFRHFQPRFNARPLLKKYGVTHRSFVVSTIHRNYNTDNPDRLRNIIRGLNFIKNDLGLEVVLPLHPRTKRCLEEQCLMVEASRLTLTEPLGYIEILSLVENANFVVTDSGGLQKEAAWLNKRSLLVMPDTCWRELVECGWNMLVEPEYIPRAANAIQRFSPPPPDFYGNGNAAWKIIEAIKTELD